MQFKGACEERLCLPVLQRYGLTGVDFCNSVGVLLGQSPSRASLVHWCHTSDHRESRYSHLGCSQ